MTHENPSSEPAEMRDEDLLPELPQTEARPEPQVRTRVQDAPREPMRRPAPSAPAAAQAAKLQPSWLLSASGDQMTRDEILARYRRQRGLPDDPFENGARPVPPPGYRDRIMSEPRPARFLERGARQPVEPPPQQPRSFTAGQTFAIAATAALVAGGAAGLTGAHFAHLLTSAPGTSLAGAPEVPSIAPLQAAGQLQLAEASAAGPAAPRDTVIAKKPIATATLQVADVTGETNSFIPLALHAEPGGLENDILLKISGVPEGAYLTSGHRQNDQVWALSLAETKDVKLVVPKTDDPQIDLAVAAFEQKTGELAAPVKTMTVALKDVVVEPTSAPPPGPVTTTPVTTKAGLPGAGSAALPQPIPPPQTVKMALGQPETEETRQLIAKADELFNSGDVKQALRGYERAWGNDGSAAAAFGIARSHDPLVLASLASNNGTADREQAIQWYQRAASGGNPDAAEAIIRLQMKP